VTVRRVEAGELELGGGLELLAAAALEGLPPGGELEVELASRAAALELPAWVRMAGHTVTNERAEQSGPATSFVVRIRRGELSRVLGDDLGERGDPLARPDGSLGMDDLRRATGPPPEHAPPAGGFVPVAAVAEGGGPAYSWRLSDRERLWADELAWLSDRAAAEQWDATTDIPWEAAADLPEDKERAVSQVMTYIAQNEYAALYVPAAFLPQVNPQYAEVLIWLSTHVRDEARHIEVFTKRALAGGVRSHALASTELSLRTLLEEHDFSSAALLLNVLGEGTFLDLLRFVERHAPDAATAAVARLAHRDERRHVHFGIAHVRRRIEADPDARDALVAAAEARAAKLTSLPGLSPLVTESLTLMCAPSLQPAELSETSAGVRRLLETMGSNRRRRLRAAGFDAATASHLSLLHTPNLM
jgi:TusA-related sulfurtransferase